MSRSWCAYLVWRVIALHGTTDLYFYIFISIYVLSPLRIAFIVHKFSDLFDFLSFRKKHHSLLAHSILMLGILIASRRPELDINAAFKSIPLLHLSTPQAPH